MSARRVRTGRSVVVVNERGAVEDAVELVVVARRAGLSVSVVRRYLALGLFEPTGGTRQAPLFAASSAARVAKADRLRRDLGLNSAGAVLACELLDRIRELETG